MARLAFQALLPISKAGFIIEQNCREGSGRRNSKAYNNENDFRQMTVAVPFLGVNGSAWSAVYNT